MSKCSLDNGLTCVDYDGKRCKGCVITERDEAVRLLRAAMGWLDITDRECHEDQFHAFRVDVAKALGEEPPLSRAEQDALCDSIEAAERARVVSDTAGIPMLLHCPMCNARHIDEGEFATKPHHTHACQSCGHCWRPAIVATVGVQFLPGFKNGSVGS